MLTYNICLLSGLNFVENLPSIFTPIENFFRGKCVGMLDDIYGIQTLNNVTNLLSLKDNGFDMSAYWDIINKTVNAAAKPFGIALLTTFFLMYVFDAAAESYSFCS